ncbi:MAG: metallophosphoesterase family protein [Candidatus Micrarchaeota archaeon]|nr:metallophosphoesterase family protein [Candidatus Micrarchaeota archaeon]MCX8154459.1 metallophosphoesterase family protein [Candidatus Micrarchaeota archaeon]
MRIGILSDTHIGLNRPPFHREISRNYARAIQVLKDCDMIIHAGDVFDRNEVRLGMMYELMKPLVDNEIGMFYILGNHDIMRTNTKREIDEFRELREISRYLLGELSDDNNVRVFTDGNVNIIGIDYDHRNVMDRIQRALDFRKSGYINILVTHQDLLIPETNMNPETALDPKYLVSLEGFDLIINGHIHRSQVMRDKTTLLIPGSTAITRYQKDELQGPKYVYIYDTYTRTLENIQIPDQRLGEIVSLNARGKSVDEIYAEIERVLENLRGKIVIIDLVLDSPVNVSKYSKETDGIKINIKILKDPDQTQETGDEIVVDIDTEMRRDWKYVYSYEELIEILDREEGIDKLIDIILKRK